MSESLYQEKIMKLAKAAHAHGRLEDADASAFKDNPLCGDRVTVDIKLSDGKVTDFAQDVKGCALCEASASLIGEHADDLSLENIEAARKAVEELLRDGKIETEAWDDIEIFKPVHAIKSRHDCVRLPFQALEKAIEKAIEKAKQ